MHIALEVFTASQALEKAAVRLFRRHQLTPAQFNVLDLLSDQAQGMRATDLAQALIVDPSNVTGLLKRMKKDGLVQELENSRDRREHIVALTEAGKTAWRAADGDYERCLSAIDATLSRVNRAAAEKVLQQLIVNAALLP